MPLYGSMYRGGNRVGSGINGSGQILNGSEKYKSEPDLFIKQVKNYNLNPTCLINRSPDPTHLTCLLNRSIKQVGLIYAYPFN